MSFGIPVRNGLGVGLLASTFLSSLRIGGRPAMSLDFIGTNSLDSRVTFTRSTTATFVGSNGLIQTAAIDAPRFDYDPVTLAPKGLLIEEARTNLFLNSLINGTVLSTQSVTVTAVPHTISFYGTGTITLSGAATATVVGTGVYPNRQTLTFTPIVGVLICTVTGSVQYAQVEVGSFATSFIPTATTTVTRNADVATMTGTNFSSWYNQSAGSFVVAADFNGSLTANASPFAVSSDLNNYSNWLAITRNGTSNVFSYNMIAASVTQSGFTNGAAVGNGVAAKAAFAFAANDLAGSTNGATAGTDTSATLPTVTRLLLGRETDGAGGTYLNGHIRQIAYYNTRLPNATLQALTA